MQHDVTTGKVMTYSEMVSNVTKMASALKKRGLKLEDVVLMMASNYIETAVSMFSIMKAGGSCASLTLNLFPGNLPKKKIYLVYNDLFHRCCLTRRGYKKTGQFCTCQVCSDGWGSSWKSAGRCQTVGLRSRSLRYRPGRRLHPHRRAVQRRWRRLAALMISLRLSSGVFQCAVNKYQTLLVECPEKLEVDMDSMAWLMYSSGTTGEPKGIVHTHRSLTLLLENRKYAALESSLKRLEIEFDIIQDGSLSRSQSVLHQLPHQFRWHVCKFAVHLGSC